MTGEQVFEELLSGVPELRPQYLESFGVDGVLVWHAFTSRVVIWIEDRVLSPERFAEEAGVRKPLHRLFEFFERVAARWEPQSDDQLGEYYIMVGLLEDLPETPAVLALMGKSTRLAFESWRAAIAKVRIIGQDTAGDDYAARDEGAVLRDIIRRSKTHE